MGLKAECLRLYRKNERLKRWQNGGFTLRRLKELKEHVISIFGEKANFIFTHGNTSSQRNIIIVREDTIHFKIYRSSDYQPKYNIELVSMCKGCGHIDFITHLAYNLKQIDDGMRLIIAHEIVDRNYKGSYLCSICKSKQQQEEASEQEAS